MDNDYEIEIYHLYSYLELKEDNLYISDDSKHNCKCELKIDSKKNSFITTFRFITKKQLKGKTLCTLDAILFARMGLVMINCDTPMMVQWAINTVPKLKVQKLNYEDNKDILSVLYIHDIVVDYIINLLVSERQTIWIADVYLNMNESSIVKRITRLEKEGITLIKNDYAKMRTKDKECDKDCPICMESIKTFVCVLSCGHSYDYDCMRSWLYTDKVRGYIRENPTCPYCRDPIM
jgi:hypothetical protein